MLKVHMCIWCCRFHLLAEFDDGKRSCRKRLAGHNERRRKPHTGMHSARTGRIFQSYAGKKHNGLLILDVIITVCYILPFK